MATVAVASNNATAASASASASATVTPCSSSSVSIPSQPFIHSFSIPWMETFIHAQVWFLSSSLFVWVGDDSCHLHSLALAIQSSMDPSPAVSCLLGSGMPLGSGSGVAGGKGSSSTESATMMGGEEESAGMSMASRIASVLKVPVFVSLNIDQVTAGVVGMGGDGVPTSSSMPLPPMHPSGSTSPELEVFIERQILKELKACDKLGLIRRSNPPKLQ